MSNKKLSRAKRSLRGRGKISVIGGFRLSVFRSLQHTYAQVIKVNGGDIVASAYSGDKDIFHAGAANSSLPSEVGDKTILAGLVGKLIAQRALSKGVVKVSFDRSGYKYHGRVKALADGAREVGLSF